MVRSFLSFTEPEPATAVNPGPAESILHPHIVLQQYQCVHYPLTHKLPKMASSLQFLLLKLLVKGRAVRG